MDLKDFSKADAVNYLDRELDLQLTEGTQLVCGDTGSDVPMVEAVMARCPDTWAFFATQSIDLAAEVAAACPNDIIVPEPRKILGLFGGSAREQGEILGAYSLEKGQLAVLPALEIE